MNTPKIRKILGRALMLVVMDLVALALIVSLVLPTTTIVSASTITETNEVHLWLTGAGLVTTTPEWGDRPNWADATSSFIVADFTEDKYTAPGTYIQGFGCDVYSDAWAVVLNDASNVRVDVCLYKNGTALWWVDDLTGTFNTLNGKTIWSCAYLIANGFPSNIYLLADTEYRLEMHFKSHVTNEWRDNQFFVGNINTNAPNNLVPTKAPYVNVDISRIVESIIYLAVFFLPGLLLNVKLPRIGMIAGMVVMTLVFMVIDITFLPYSILVYITLAILLIRGDWE